MCVSYRCFLRICLGAALIGATMVCATNDVRAQQTQTANPTSPPPNTATAPAAPPVIPQSAFDQAPKDIITFDPCKISNPPAYCNAK
jgi:hypothetical protein